MTQSMSVFSNRTITTKGLGRLMQELGADVEVPNTWLVEREGHYVRVVISNDMDWLPRRDLMRVADELEARPRSRIALLFNPRSADALEYDLARAVAVAMAEIWPVVLDDNMGTIRRVYSPTEGTIRRHERSE